MKYKITARKFGGDDAYSWAVFVNGSPVVTGLSRSEVAYHKKHITEMYAAKGS
jgi:hypothetical protein